MQNFNFQKWQIQEHCKILLLAIRLLDTYEWTTVLKKHKFSVEEVFFTNVKHSHFLKKKIQLMPYCSKLSS